MYRHLGYEETSKLKTQVELPQHGFGTLVERGCGTALCNKTSFRYITKLGVRCGPRTIYGSSVQYSVARCSDSWAKARVKDTQVDSTLCGLQLSPEFTYCLDRASHRQDGEDRQQLLAEVQSGSSSAASLKIGQMMTGASLKTPGHEGLDIGLRRYIHISAALVSPNV